MPSPIGHALGGLAAGCLVSRHAHWRAVAVFSVVGMLPDLDFLLPVQHRGASHSITAALVVFAIALLVLEIRPRRHRVRLAAAVGAAYLSHTILDWLGQDTWSPRGIMALWPFSHTFYVSGLDVFHAVNRRYWTPGFLRGNAIAVVREIILLAPIALLSRWQAARNSLKLSGG